MRTVTASQLKSKAEELLQLRHGEQVLITRAGKPIAVLTNVSGYDAEDIELASSPEFWRMIKDRRQEKTIPFEELMARIDRKSSKKSTSARPVKPRTKKVHKPAIVAKR
jgi:prevent-host-death family protein